MEKILNYTLDLEGGSPTEPFCAGYQGEHRATAIIFTPTAKLSEEISKRQGAGSRFSVTTELLTEAGEIFSSEETDISALCEPFFITGDMSESGLDSKVIIRITETDINGNKAEFLRGDVSIYFLSGRGYGSLSDKGSQVDLIEEKTAEALILIEGKCAEAEGIVSEGIAEMQRIKASSSDQLKKTVAAADEAEEFATEAKNATVLCSKAVDSSISETEKARQYCLHAGNYREAAGEAAANAEASANKAGEFLVQVELYTSRNGEILEQNLACAETCNKGSETAEDAAERAMGFAEAAEAYSDSAVNGVKAYIDTTFGDVGAVLDSIIALQQGYIGGDSL